MADATGAPSSHVLKWAALGILGFVLLVIVSGLALVSRGQDEMMLSDRAFHDGELRKSIFHARKAALAFVPGAEHVELAYGRLEAIARGAEAQGDEALARTAWEALRGSIEQTSYPGRPSVQAKKDAVNNLNRLRRAREHDSPHQP